MKKIVLVMIVALVAMIATSCGSKESALKELNTFVEQLEKEKDNYNLNDWQKAERKYAKIMENLQKYEKDLTEDEQYEVSRLSINCAAMFSKAALEAGSSMGSALNDLFNSVGAATGSTEEVTTVEELEETSSAEDGM